jgi:hypothetical protein
MAETAKPSMKEMIEIISGQPLENDFWQRPDAQEISTKASNVLYGDIGANTDARDWGKIMKAEDPYAAAREGLKNMYSDKNYLVANQAALDAQGYSVNQADHTYKQMVDRVGSTYDPNWKNGLPVKQTATGGSSTGLIASNAPTLTQNYDTSPSKNTPTEMAKMGGFTLPEGWDKYTPSQKIAFYNSNSIGGNTLLKAGVQQWELDWMRKNGYNAPDTFTPPVTPGGLIGTGGATKQTNPYALNMTGLVNQGKTTTLADSMTGNSNPGSKITSASQQLTAPLAATATLPNGAVAKTTGGMGYSTGNASTTPGVENWYNALTGQSRVVVPGAFTPPDANWKKA